MDTEWAYLAILAKFYSTNDEGGSSTLQESELIQDNFEMWYN